jgi:hypothetical protein
VKNLLLESYSRYLWCRKRDTIFWALFKCNHLILNIVGFSCSQLFSFFILILNMTISNTISNCIYYEICVFNYIKGFLILIVLIFWSANQNRTHSGHRAAWSVTERWPFCCLILSRLQNLQLEIGRFFGILNFKNGTNWNILIILWVKIGYNNDNNFLHDFEDPFLKELTSKSTVRLSLGLVFAGSFHHYSAVENPADIKIRINCQLKQPAPSRGHQVHDSFI